jgi:hypothetical protein
LDLARIVLLVGPIVLGAPIGPLLATLGIAATLYFVGTRKTLQIRSGTPVALLIVQVALVPVAWLVIGGAADIESSYSGAQCKDYTSVDGLVWGLLWLAVVLGGLSFGSATVNDTSRVGRNFMYGAIAVTVPYVIGAKLFVTIACSTWN